MQLFEGGPDIPLEVLQAQEDESLVIFCGAGISASAGLPTFKGLVDSVRKSLGATFDLSERTEYRAKAYDRVLGLLERPHRHPTAVRAAVADRLTHSVDADLDVHRSLLALGRRRSGALQLITTNFDTLFQSAGATVVLDAPRLPIPNPNTWDGLVHLHGRLSAGDPAHRHLVLTSADFGRAYLVERWAARFVAELFQRSHVLFVGYSANDPVMRYLIDAIAADRQSDARYHSAYALAADEGHAEAEWHSKGIIPILYSPKEGHAALRTTLRVWSTSFNDGVGSKAAIVSEFAEREPSAVGPEVHDQMRWALRDASGAPGRQLEQIGSNAPLEWIGAFESGGGGGWGPGVGLVGSSPPRLELSPAQWAVAGWLCSHVSSVELLAWVVERGGALHQRFRWRLLNALDAHSSIDPALRAAWWLVAEQGAVHSDDSDYFRLADRVKGQPWDPVLLLAILRALAPTLECRRSTATLFRGGPGESLDDRLAAVLSLKCRLECEANTEEIVDALVQRPDWSGVAPDLLPRIDGLLQTSLDLLVASRQAGDGYDPCATQIPSIAPHAQNSHLEGWLWHVELIRRCLLASRGSHALTAVTRRWSDSRLPVLRRLLIYAAHTTGTPSPMEFSRLLVEQPAEWLWNVRLQVELFPFLSSLRKQLDEKAADSVRLAIEAGPPDHVFRADADSAAVQRQRDRLIWDRLARFLPPLAKSENATLRRLADAYPDLTLSDEDAFLVWVTSGWQRDDDTALQTLARATDEQLRSALAGLVPLDDLSRAWRGVVQSDAERAIGSLEWLLGDQRYTIAAEATLFGLQQASLSDLQKARVLDLLISAPNSPATVSSVAAVLREWSTGAPHLHDRLLALISQARATAWALPFQASQDILNAAIRTAAGSIAEATLEILTARSMPRDSGLPADVEPLLTSMARSDASAAPAGRVLLASRLAMLHDIDPAWTHRELLPWFAWATPNDAAGCWQGFLWSPWTRPSLWRRLKPHALRTVEHLDRLGQGRSAYVQLMVAVSVDGGGLSPAMTRRFLRSVEPGDRVTVAAWLHRRLMSTDDRRYWARHARWVSRVWPTERALQSASISSVLSRIPIAWPSHFSAGVDMVLPLLVPNDNWHYVAGKVADLLLDLSASEKAVALLDAVVPENLLYGAARLTHVLNTLETAHPSLSSNGALARLRRVARVYG